MWRPGGIETRQPEPPGPTPRENEERGEDCCTAQRERVRAHTATSPRSQDIFETQVDPTQILPEDDVARHVATIGGKAAGSPALRLSGGHREAASGLIVVDGGLPAGMLDARLAHEAGDHIRRPTDLLRGVGSRAARPE